MKNIMVYLYAIFLLLFSVFSYTFIDPNLMYLEDIYSGFAFDNRFITTFLYVIFISVFFIFYGSFVWLGLRKKLRFKDVFILVSITIGGLIFSYPAMLSYDIFNYITTSKVLFFYSENPYIIMPIEFIGDTFLSFTHAANKIALYGPIWILLTGIPYVLGLGNFIITLLSFKIFIALFYAATTILIWKISKNIIPLILFAFNPLIIIETLVSGHNDIVMIFLVLLSFLLLIKKKIFLGTLFFVLSIFIKYTTILLFPVFLFMVWKTIRKKEFRLEKVFYYSSLLMIIAFLLSPIREEIYPWYAIWFLSFTFLIPEKKLLLYISIAFSFGLLFKYIPFMLSGTHAGISPLIKLIVTFVPAILISFYIILRTKLWERIFSR